MVSNLPMSHHAQPFLSNVGVFLCNLFNMKGLIETGLLYNSPCFDCTPEFIWRPPKAEKFLCSVAGVMQWIPDATAADGFQDSVDVLIA